MWDESGAAAGPAPARRSASSIWILDVDGLECRLEGDYFLEKMFGW